MYSHVLVGSNDIARSKKFYDALFTAIGGQPGAEMRPGRIAYTHNGARFVVTVPNDGKPATAANGGTIGFNIGDPKLAEAWHKAGVANGGTSIEDPPGVRPNGAYRVHASNRPDSEARPTTTRLDLETNTFLSADEALKLPNFA